MLGSTCLISVLLYHLLSLLFRRGLRLSILLGVVPRHLCRPLSALLNHLRPPFPQGLRLPILLGSFGTMLAAWIKVGSLSPDRFYVTFIGQTVAAVAQIFVLGIPAKLAAVWFGQDQVSSACAIGVFGNQVRRKWSVVVQLH